MDSNETQAGIQMWHELECAYMQTHTLTETHGNVQRYLPEGFIQTVKTQDTPQMLSSTSSSSHTFLYVFFLSASVVAVVVLFVPLCSPAVSTLIF